MKLQLPPKLQKFIETKLHYYKSTKTHHYIYYKNIKTYSHGEMLPLYLTWIIAWVVLAVGIFVYKRPAEALALWLTITLCGMITMPNPKEESIIYLGKKEKDSDE